MKRGVGIAAPDAGSELKDPIGRAEPTLEAISGDAAPPSHLFQTTEPDGCGAQRICEIMRAIVMVGRVLAIHPTARSGGRDQPNTLPRRITSTL